MTLELTIVHGHVAGLQQSQAVDLATLTPCTVLLHYIKLTTQDGDLCLSGAHLTPYTAASTLCSSLTSFAPTHCPSPNTPPSYDRKQECTKVTHFNTTYLDIVLTKAI
jgi:hypothetical protein